LGFVTCVCVFLWSSYMTYNNYIIIIAIKWIYTDESVSVIVQCGLIINVLNRSNILTGVYCVSEFLFLESYFSPVHIKSPAISPRSILINFVYLKLWGFQKFVAFCVSQFFIRIILGTFIPTKYKLKFVRRKYF